MAYIYEIIPKDLLRLDSESSNDFKFGSENYESILAW